MIFALINKVYCCLKQLANITEIPENRKAPHNQYIRISLRRITSDNFKHGRFAIIGTKSIHSKFSNLKGSKSSISGKLAFDVIP